MSNFSESRYLDRVSGADLSAALYHLVVEQADSTNPTGRSLVLATGSTQNLFGVLNNSPKAGETANVCGRNAQGTFLVQVGAGQTIAFGDSLTSDTLGCAKTTTTTGDQVFGLAEQAGVAGQFIEYRCVDHKYGN
jgi:hypothetical protein